jgi:hypothetical protein
VRANRKLLFKGQFRYPGGNDGDYVDGSFIRGGN